MDPRAIIAALPWLRRLWRVTPTPLRVPLLLVAAGIGIWQFLQGRKQRGHDAGRSPGSAAATPSTSSVPGRAGG